jgi:hypothetical protein
MILSIYEQAKKTHKKFQMYKETTLLKGRKKNKSQTMKHPRKLLPKIICLKKIKYALFHATFRKITL